jgi:hypothetical protein
MLRTLIPGVIMLLAEMLRTLIPGVIMLLAEFMGTPDPAHTRRPRMQTVLVCRSLVAMLAAAIVAVARRA